MAFMGRLVGLDPADAAIILWSALSSKKLDHCGNTPMNLATQRTLPTRTSFDTPRIKLQTSQNSPKASAEEIFTFLRVSMGMNGKYS